MNNSLSILRVQPVPTPFSIIAENTNNNKLGINNQKLMLFNLGNLILLTNLIIKQLIKVVSYPYGLCFHPYFYGASRIVSEDPTR